jgi:methyl-accepting chemotaxis protein
MNFAALNEIVGSWYTIGFVSVGLLVWTALSAAGLNRACRVLRQALDSARARIGRIEQPALARSFEALRGDLGRDPLLGPSWLAFAETVVVPREGVAPPRATLRPEQIFDLSLLARAGANLRYHAALPGLLVGAGLLFTFFGLSVALVNAAAIVTATDTATRNASLRGLLDAASIKFWTSLVGLACSIAYAFWRSRRLRAVEHEIDGFCVFLEERFPLATPALLQTEANRLLEKQTKLVDDFVNNLATKLGDSLSQALDDRLRDHIGPLTKAIEKLAARETEALGNTLQQLVEKFVAQLERAGTDQLTEVARQLAEAAQGLSVLRQSLDHAASGLGSAAETLSNRMEQGAGSAAARLAEAMDGVARTLRELVQASGEAAQAQIGGAVTAVAQASEEAAARLQASIEASGARFVQAVEGTAGRLEGAAARFEAASEATGRAGAAIAEASAGLSEAAQQASASLRAGARPVGEAAAEFRRAAETSAEALARVAQLAEALQQAGALVTTASQSFTRAVDGATALQHQLGATAEGFDRIDRSLGATLQAVADQLRGFADQIERVVKDVDAHLGKAVTSLGASIQDLADAAEELREARSAPVRS